MARGTGKVGRPRRLKPQGATAAQARAEDIPANRDDNLSSSQAAYHAIKRDIIQCELTPGSEVTEAQLVEKYDFGKSPVRWALANLRKDGLVTALPRRGYVVSSITIQDINDLFDLRLILEPRAARMAVGRVDTDALKSLSEFGDSVYLADDRDAERSFLDASRRFHVVITTASGNRKLARMLNQILEEMERLYHLCLALKSEIGSISQDHHNLVEAFVNGDADRVEELSRDQIQAARKVILGAILGSASLQQYQISVPAHRGG